MSEDTSLDILEGSEDESAIVDSSKNGIWRYFDSVVDGGKKLAKCKKCTSKNNTIHVSYLK